MKNHQVLVSVRYLSAATPMFEIPFRSFFYGEFSHVRHTQKKVVLEFDSSIIPDPPKILFLADFTKHNGSVRLGEFSLKFDGLTVAKGDMDGFDTNVKNPGQIDATLRAAALDIWTGGARIKLDGNAQNDQLYGTNERDVFYGKGGNDAFFGRGGEDLANGGGGGDQLIMGGGKDTAYGGKGNDFIHTGHGNFDRSWGGPGNDVLGFGAGHNKTAGNDGRDVFAFDANLPDSGGKWAQKAKTVVTDFNGNDDVLIFHNLPSGALPVTGNDAAATLDDLNPADIPGMTWHENKAGALVIKVGEHTVVLKNTTAADVDLDKLAFSHDSARSFGASFKDDGGAHSIGTTLHGGIDEIVVDHSGPGAQIHTPDAGVFDTYQWTTGTPSYLDFL